MNTNIESMVFSVAFIGLGKWLSQWLAGHFMKAGH